MIEVHADILLFVRFAMAFEGWHNVTRHFLMFEVFSTGLPTHHQHSLR